MDIEKVINWSFTAGFESAEEAGFSDEEMQQLRLRWGRLRDRVISQRVRDLPKDVEDAIVWGALIDFAVPYRSPDITPDRCYYMLPLRHAEYADEYDTLVLSPVSGQWARVPRAYSSDFIEWLNRGGDGFASEWMRAMIGEFGLQDDMLGAWVTPFAGSGVLDGRAFARFWHELRAARRNELTKRLADVAEWIDGMGIPSVSKKSRLLCIPPSAIDYDPEQTTFVLPFVLVGKECSLLFVAGRRIPVLCRESFQRIELRLAGYPVEKQHYWLRILLED